MMWGGGGGGGEEVEVGHGSTYMYNHTLLSKKVDGNTGCNNTEPL